MNTAEDWSHYHNTTEEPTEQKPAEIIDLASKRAEAAKEEHPTWPVTIDEHGNIHGLPEGKEPRDVIVLMGNDGKWYAQNPSPETLEEMRAWRPDWIDPRAE